MRATANRPTPMMQELLDPSLYDPNVRRDFFEALKAHEQDEERRGETAAQLLKSFLALSKSRW